MNNVERFADLDDSAAVLFTSTDARKSSVTGSRMFTTNALTDPDQGHIMRGQLTTPASVVSYILAGNATLTLVSKKTGSRLTLKFQRPDPEPSRRRPVFAKVLTGSDNVNDFEFVGTIWPDATWTYKHSAKSRVTENAPSVAALKWMVRLLNMAPEALLAQAEVWHEGRCGRCGRKLTVPSSIESGFGPECVKMI